MNRLLVFGHGPAAGDRAIEAFFLPTESGSSDHGR
jgi:hypothetical protein